MATSALEPVATPGRASDEPADEGKERRDPVALFVHSVLPLALLSGVLLLMVRLAATPLTNTDTYFHLRFGHEFVTGKWSIRDPGSVSSFATADWVPTQWLPQVLMAKVEDWFGLAGVAWLAGLLFLTLAVTYFVVARRLADPMIATAFMVLGLCASAAGMSMRPQVISYVLVAVTTSVWLHARTTGRPPWLLVPLTWVWAMCHGMWPAGLVIGVVVALTAPVDDRSVNRLRLLAVPALSGLAACATPVGPRLVEAVLLVNSRGEYFTEWGSPEFTHLNTLAVLVMLGVTALAAMRTQSSWVEIALLFLAAAWSVYSLRTVPVAAAILVPLGAAGVQRLRGSRQRTSRLERRWVAGSMGAAVVLLALQVPTSGDAVLPQPEWLEAELSALPAGTKVLSDTGHGGFLMWRFPQLDLLRHGYGDSYTTEELDRNATIANLQPGWIELLRESEVTYAVLDPTEGLGYALTELAGWSVVKDSPNLQLLVPPSDWQG